MEDLFIYHRNQPEKLEPLQDTRGGEPVNRLKTVRIFCGAALLLYLGSIFAALLYIGILALL